LIPEVPELQLDMAALKDRVEQGGAKVASMAKYKNFEASRPQYLICMILNFIPNLGTPPPQGSERRLRWLKMENVHGDGPACSAEDPDLKAEFIKKMHLMDLFHMCKSFYTRLCDYSTNISMPDCVHREF